jgi:hypothetical protein
LFCFPEGNVRAPPPRELNELEATLNNIERDCCEVTGNLIIIIIFDDKLEVIFTFDFLTF